MPMRSTLSAAIGFAAIAGLSAHAQSEDSAHHQLSGIWASDCNAWGTPAHCHVIWQQGLHTSHMTIHYRIANAADDSTIFEGTGTYRQTDETTLDGYWSDSQGAIHPLSGSWEDNALTTHWGIAGETVGRTRYTLNEDDSLTVTDWQLTEEGWAQFMEARYTRSDN